MRVSICVIRNAVRCPPYMANSDNPFYICTLYNWNKSVKFSGFFKNRNAISITYCDARGVISPIFHSPHSFKQNIFCLFFSYISNNTAHVKGSPKDVKIFFSVFQKGAHPQQLFLQALYFYLTK